MRNAVSLALAGILFVVPSAIRADELGAPPALLAKLASTSSRFEAMMHKASFTIEGRMGSVSGDGTLSVTQEGAARVRMRGDRADVEILKYVEDGEDKTSQAKERSKERARQRKPRKPGEEMHMPFLEGEQAKYDFHVGEVDPHDSARVRIFFHAKEAAENRMNGSAWVDTRTGDLLTASVTASKTPAFVSYVRAQLEFGESTSMGPALSKVSFEGAGGFLFIRKHFRGSATMSSYGVGP